jgi:hypothetical protein
MPKLWSKDTRDKFLKLFGKDINFFKDTVLMECSDLEEFDLFKLDEFLTIPENETLHDFIFKTKGEEALSLIERLVKNSKELYQ